MRTKDYILRLKVPQTTRVIYNVSSTCTKTGLCVDYFRDSHVKTVREHATRIVGYSFVCFVWAAWCWSWYANYTIYIIQRCHVPEAASTLYTSMKFADYRRIVQTPPRIRQSTLASTYGSMEYVQYRRLGDMYNVFGYDVCASSLLY